MHIICISSLVILYYNILYYITLNHIILGVTEADGGEDSADKVEADHVDLTSILNIYIYIYIYI
jgi:hypothetical protein